MAAWLLTWNPAHYDITARTYAKHVAATEAGRTVRMDWSTGQNRDRIVPGDTVYWLRQGSEGRGLVGSGIATGVIHQEPHFNEPAKMQSYVPVDWQIILPVDDRLETDTLVELVPAVKWKYVLGSGQAVRPEAEVDLARVWRNHVSSTGRRP